MGNTVTLKPFVQRTTIDMSNKTSFCELNLKVVLSKGACTSD